MALNTLYCGGCRELLPLDMLKYHKGMDSYICEKCRKNYKQGDAWKVVKY